MGCNLCNSINEEHSFICENEHAFSVIVTGLLKHGHVMLLPKRHITNLKDFEKEESFAFFQLLSKVGKTIKDAYGKDIIYFMNTGVHSTQEHIHFHIIPSEAGIRPLVSCYENVPKRKAISEEETRKMRDHIKRFL